MSQTVHLHHGRKSKVTVNDTRITTASKCGPTAVDENDSSIVLDAAKDTASAGQMKVWLTGRNTLTSAQPEYPPPDDEVPPPDGSLLITLIDAVGAAFIPAAAPLVVTYDTDPGPGPGPSPAPPMKRKKTTRKMITKKPAKKKGTKMMKTKKATKKKTAKKPAKKPAKKRKK